MLKPIIGITMGDAAGIGPEITAKSLNYKEIYDVCKPFILGDFRVIRDIIKICNLKLNLNKAADLKDCKFEFGTVDVLDYNDLDPSDFKFGEVNPLCGKAAVNYTIEAGKMALENKIHAMVSAPLHKGAMRAAGYNYEGQTQILGELTKSDNYGMILVLENLNILMYSTHMSLRKACDKVTYEGVFKKILLANEGLKFFNKKNSVIAVAALNPHSGEGGIFGNEETDFIAPAVNKAKEMGINVVGPIPGDTVFVRAKNGEFDLVIAMYHDQANIVMKILGFGEVVTLLAGIPIIRTSTGHGTAFDIAGKNKADEKNLYKAIELAAKLGVKKINN